MLSPSSATSYWRFWQYNIHTPIAKNASKHWHMARLARELRGMDPDLFYEDEKEVAS